MSHGTTRLAAALALLLTTAALLVAQAPTAEAAHHGAARCRTTVDAVRGSCNGLTVTVEGRGTVTSSPGSISCREAVPPRPGRAAANVCQDVYGPNQVVTLSALPDTGYHLASWGGACSGTDGLTCELTMTTSQDVTAVFSNTYVLGTQVVGDGTVTSDPAGIDCRGDVPTRPRRADLHPCAAGFDEDTEVTLTATPGAHQRFVGWSAPSGSRLQRDPAPSCSGSSETCTVTMTDDVAVVATFALATHILRVKVDGGGRVTSAPYTDIDCPFHDGRPRRNGASNVCSTIYADGTEITLTATPDPGQQFAGWSEWSPARPHRDPAPVCSGTTRTCTFTMSDEINVLAMFTSAPSVYMDMLHVTVTGDGQGTVTSAPAGIDCGADCDAAFLQGSTVTLTAVAAPGSRFAGFTGGACAGSGSSCTVTMSRPQRVTAEFVPTETPDTSPPQTVITFGPRYPANDHSRFGFRSDEPGSTFQCSMDGGPRQDCVSGVDFPCLAPGRHTFRVWATDPAGNTDPTAASRRFRVHAAGGC